MEVKEGSTAWALIMMEQGKSVRRKVWDSHEFYMLKRKSITDEGGYTFDHMYIASDWELYRPSRKGNFLEAVEAYVKDNDCGVHLGRRCLVEFSEGWAIAINKDKTTPLKLEHFLSKDWVIYENN